MRMKTSVKGSRRALGPSRRLVGWSFFLFFAFMHLSAFMLTKPASRPVEEASRAFPLPLEIPKKDTSKEAVEGRSVRASPPRSEIPKGSLPARRTARILPHDVPE